MTCYCKEWTLSLYVLCSVNHTTENVVKSVDVPDALVKKADGQIIYEEITPRVGKFSIFFIQGFIIKKQNANRSSYAH